MSLWSGPLSKIEMVLLQCRFGMEIRQLRYLVALAAEENFTRAAARAHVAQPALSRQIQKLEDELGVALVDRTSRRVSLTPVGAELADRARTILADLDAATDRARGTAGRLTGRVVLGITYTSGPVDVHKLLRGFHARDPNIELATEEDLSVRLAERLRADEMDLAVLASTDAPDQLRGLATKLLAVEPLVAVLAVDDPLAAETAVHLAHLAQRPLVVGPAGASVRRLLAQSATAAGLTLRFAFESNVNARILDLVADGLAATVLPFSDVPAGDTGIRAVPLADPALVHRVMLARRSRRRLSPASLILARLLLEHRPLTTAPEPDGAPD